MLSNVSAQKAPTVWYAGAQAGVPLFWGDIRSIGEKTKPGFGGGLFLGVRANPWLAFEPSVDYGVGKLGASKWQTEDYINKDGVIKYIAGDWKLGQVYSRTSFLRAGLRVPVSIVKAFSPFANNRFEIEIAPHIALNKFSPGIYDINTKKKLSGGVKPAGWAYAAGGDVSFNYNINPRTAIFLRPAVSWLSDERYEGISSEPAWRVNVMAYTTAGIRINFGKALPVKTKAAATVSEPAAINQPEEKAAEAVVVEKQETVVADNTPEVKEDEATKSRRELLNQMQNESVPVIYFRRGYAVLQKQYNNELQELLALAKKYEFAPVVIEGWCDVTGTQAFNKKLSEKRAFALRDWLVNNGVDFGRITTRAMGEDEANGTSQEGRRAALKFIARDQ